MTRNLELINRTHDLRDILTLLDMAAASIDEKQQRDAMQRGMMVAEDLLKQILSIVEPREASQ